MMQTPQGSQRSIQRRSPIPDSGSQHPSSTTGSVVTAQSEPWPPSASVSGRSPTSSRRQNYPQSPQLSQIEKSVTHLLVATKQLLETLTQWSRHTATEAEVSDVYVRLGYEFNIACRAFTSIGVETSDLGPVPDLLRAILEDTLSQEASPASLDKYLPKIRDIIINLLHGLKKKQQRLRSRQGGSSRQSSVGSMTSADTGLMQTPDDAASQRLSSRRSARRIAAGENPQLEDQQGVPPRTSSYPNGRASPVHQESMSLMEAAAPTSNQDGPRPHQHSASESSMSSNTLQNLPVLSPSEVVPMPDHTYPTPSDATHFPAPPPPPKEQDALGALQRSGDLERRASRRYSAYQLSKHLGSGQGGASMLPPTQNSPIPNRGRDVRESMNAVRIRGSLLHSRQRSTNRLADGSPVRNNAISRRISEEGGQTSATPAIRPPDGVLPEDSPVAKTPDDKIGRSYTELDGNDKPVVGATLTGPSTNGDYGAPSYAGIGEARGQAAQGQMRGPDSMQHDSSVSDRYAGPSATMPHSQLFLPEQSPPPTKELTLFLQYKSRIKKIVLPDGYDELSVARLQLAFIDKFAWNTHSNGEDLPDIYIQDPISGVRHELEDLSDIKDRSVLVLNVEALDEVKRHIDESVGGLRRLVEGVRTVVDGQQSALQLVSDRQRETAKEMARLAAGPAPISVRRPTFEKAHLDGLRSSSASVDNSSQLSEVQSLRRDLAVVRQAYSSFASDIANSMSNVRTKAASVRAVAVNAAVPILDSASGRAHLNASRKALGEDSEKIVNRVDDLQDIVEDLRKDVVTRGVRPLPRQLESVSKDISTATAELKKMQEYLKREKPVWSNVWTKDLEQVCIDKDFLSMQEELAADLEDDLEKATQTFALVEQATKQQHLQTGPAGSGVRSTSRGFAAAGSDHDVDPVKAQEGVLGEVRALQPNHETRLEAIERSERARQRELESRRGGEFQKELGSFVEEGKLKRSGGVEEAERMRKAKDEKIRMEVWERQQARAAGKGKEAENLTSAQDAISNEHSTTKEGKSPEQGSTEEGDEHATEEEHKSNENEPSSTRTSWLPAIITSHLPHV